nr:SRPBCC domain-containing protein [Actinoplanes humidus]
MADVVGTVVEASAPRRLVTTWADPARPEAVSEQVTFEIEPFHGIVRLTVTHENLASEQAHSDVASGWPAVLSNLKTLLETGQVLSQAPWTMGR